MSRDSVGIVDETPYPGPNTDPDNPFPKPLKLGPGRLTTGTVVMNNNRGQVVPYVNAPGNIPIGMIGNMDLSPPGTVLIIPLDSPYLTIGGTS